MARGRPFGPGRLTRTRRRRQHDQPELEALTAVTLPFGLVAVACGLRFRRRLGD